MPSLLCLCKWLDMTWFVRIFGFLLHWNALWKRSPLYFPFREYVWALLFQLLKLSFPSLRYRKLMNTLWPSLSSKYRPSSDQSFSMCPSVSPFFPTFQALHLSNTDFINPSCFTASDILIYCSISLVHFSLSICFFCALEQTIQKETKSRVAGLVFLLLVLSPADPL